MDRVKPSLILFDTLTRSERVFEPQDRSRIVMYVCGPTVYDEPHLGHGRSAVVFDLLFRVLREIYGEEHVIYVRNYTDVDDKIIARAQELKVPIETVTRKYISAYESAMEYLHCLPPTHTPKVTEFIPHIIQFIEGLIQKGKAYEISGAVFFDVSSFPSYGKLSHHSPDELLSGHRIEVDPRKKNPLDFALWKDAKEGEPFWESPWGKGRPGWHIECSVMSTYFSGGTLDIHGGGQDLIFPHHENEIAQWEALTDKPFSRYWVHNGFVQIRREKMSKSLKNFITIFQLKEQFPSPIVRYFLLSSHYRSPLDYSVRSLLNGGKALFRLYEIFSLLELPRDPHSSFPKEDLSGKVDFYQDEAFSALLDDLNTPKSFGSLFQLVRLLNGYRSLFLKGVPAGKEGDRFIESLKKLFSFLNRIFGLFPYPFSEFLSRWNQMGFQILGISKEEVERLVSEREEWRKKGEFDPADRIREKLRNLGVEVADLPSARSMVRVVPEALLKALPEG